MSMNVQPVSKDRVLLVEPSFMMCICLRELIETMGPFRVVGESQDGNTTLESLSEIDPDIVVIDIDTNFTEYLKFIQAIHEFNPCIVIVALSMDMDDYFQKKCIDAGAWACLPMPCSSEKFHQTLMECVNRIPPKSCYQH